MTGQSFSTEVTHDSLFSLTLEEPQAGIGFPHLGIGTAISPSLSPSISLRASAFAEERGKRDCVSQSDWQDCEPAKETLTFILDDASHNLLHGVLIYLLLFIWKEKCWHLRGGIGSTLQLLGVARLKVSKGK